MRVSAALGRALSAGVLMAMACSATAQQAYPSKPIRLIVPYAPGGTTTNVARLIGQRLAENWGQQVIVDNRPGANTMIGTEALFKSAPDGYSIMLSSSNHVIVPLLSPVSFDTVNGFAPVATLVSNGLILVVNAGLPVSNLQEFIALAKSKPGQLNHSSSDNGGLVHLSMELFAMIAGVKIQNIPYKGGGPALTDLIGGQVQLSFQSPVAVIAHVNAGRMKGLAVSGANRLSALPQVPTFTEAGLPGYDAKIWFGVLAPGGTPKAIIDKLSNEIARILDLPDFKDKLASQGMEPFISTPAQYAALLKGEMSKFTKIIKTANIKIEN